MIYSVVVELTCATAVQARTICGVEYPLFLVSPRTIWHAFGTVRRLWATLVSDHGLAT